MFFEWSLNNKLMLAALLAVAALFAYYASAHPMDLRVYHYGARGVFDGTRPVYGAASGLGWPMHYRYPPLFLLLFAPLAMLPMGAAAALWVLAKIGVLVWILRTFGKRGLLSAISSPGGYLVCFLFISPYLIEEFRYENAQFFVIALTIASLLLTRERPALAAAALGLAISMKVWPVFFVPYLAARREWRLVGYTIAAVVMLSLLPSVYFGFSGNVDLLGQWFRQEFQTQLGESEIWFPNQSLRGVLMRYLTVIDYSQVPDSNYAQVNVTAIAPATIRLVWIILAAAIYAGFLILTHLRRAEKNPWLDHALAFCLLALLQPFTQKYALAVLLVPAIIAATLPKNRIVRTLVYVATVLVLIQPLAPGADAQRFLQVLGFDFAATLMLTLALAYGGTHELDGTSKTG